MAGHIKTPWASWFEQAEPGLLTNPTIRAFISPYTQEQWPDVVKLTLLHGILCLRKEFGFQQLTIPELKGVVERGHYALSIEDSVPALKKDLDSITAKVAEFAKELNPGVSLTKTRLHSSPCQLFLKGKNPACLLCLSSTHSQLNKLRPEEFLNFSSGLL